MRRCTKRSRASKQTAQDAEIARLRKEVAKLKMERDIVKRGRGLLGEGVDAKFGLVAKLREAWSVDIVCEALGVSPARWLPCLADAPRCKVAQL